MTRPPTMWVVTRVMLPSLVMNRIGIVQALDRRVGSVFYMDVKYGTTKGSIAAGADMLNAKTGHNRTAAGRRYAMEYVYGEAVGAAGSTVYSHTLAIQPVKSGTVVVTNGVETFTDNGAGVMVSSLSTGTPGTINYTTGVVAVTFAASSVAIPTVDYRFIAEKSTDGGVAEVDVSLSSSVIAAQDFKLRTRYTLGASIDLEKAYGLALENEMVKYLAGEIKFELDHMGIDKIVEAAEGVNSAGSAGTFDASVGSGQEWLWKKYQLVDFVEKGSNLIFSKTLRATATFIVCGNNVARVIKQLDPHFKAEGGADKVAPTGPMVIGTLDGRLVVQDPFLAPNRMYLGYKGNDILTAGLIYAPYIPLFSTPTLVTSDLQAQKGFMAASGYKIVNEGMYAYGDIANLI